MSPQPSEPTPQSEPDATTIAAGARSAPGFGSYRLLEKLGEGGMGEVWLAEQTAPVRRRVALKVIKLGMDTRQIVARFEAERQALALMDHPAIATLQALYFRQKRYEDALPIALKVLETPRRVSGEDHPLTLTCAHNLATVYDALGRFDEAEPLFLRTIAQKRRVLGEMHPETCGTRRALGAMYRKQGRYAEAEPLLDSAHEGLTRALGAGHRDTLRVVDELVRLYDAWGKPDKAARWRKRLPPPK